MRNVMFGRALFGMALAGLAVLSLVYGNFAPALDPIPGSKALSYGLGAILLLASIGLFLMRTATASAVTIGIYASAWAVARGTPIIHHPLSIGSWYGSSEAVTTLVGAWTLAVATRNRAGAVSSMGDVALRVARALLGAACVVYGIAHFAYAAYSTAFVPTWLPGRVALVYATGACHVAAGVALLVGVLARLAATLEAIMITLFGVMVWLPSYLANPTPKWAGSPQNQWSETLITFLLAGTAWIVAATLRNYPWGFTRKR